MDERLVEEEILAVAVYASDVVNEDMALVGIGRLQAKVVAQRPGERIAMRAKLAAGRQQREHRAVNGGYGIQKGDGFRTERARRGQRVLVPFEIEALPTLLVERIEAPIVIPGGGPDVALVKQVKRLIANRLPVLTQGPQLRELFCREQRPVGDAGE